MMIYLETLEEKLQKEVGSNTGSYRVTSRSSHYEGDNARTSLNFKIMLRNSYYIDNQQILDFDIPL